MFSFSKCFKMKGGKSLMNEKLSCRRIDVFTSLDPGLHDIAELLRLFMIAWENTLWISIFQLMS